MNKLSDSGLLHLSFIPLPHRGIYKLPAEEGAFCLLVVSSLEERMLKALFRYRECWFDGIDRRYIFRGFVTDVRESIEHESEEILYDIMIEGMLKDYKEEWR